MYLGYCFSYKYHRFCHGCDVLYVWF